MTFACPTCRVEVAETANYCSTCGGSLIAPGLAKAEAAPEPEVEPEPEPEGNWFSRVFRFAKASRPGSRFSWSVDFEVTTSGSSASGFRVEPPDQDLPRDGVLGDDHR